MLAILAASCSSGFSRPRAQSLAEVDGTVYALVDPDPNRNTQTTVARLQSTTDGRRWVPVGETVPDNVGMELGRDGVSEKCDTATASCFRTLSRNGGISLERSRDGGETWSEVWSITAGRLDFQDRCCGTRGFEIRDLEYVPGTGLVAVALAEYGLLTRGVDGEVRLNTLGRPDRPESALMVGIYAEPLFAAVVALAIGYITTEQKLGRLRDRLENHMGDAGHEWLTGRARQTPVIFPVVFVLALGGVGAALVRVLQGAQRDLPQASGWVTFALAVVALAAVAFGTRLLHDRHWRADEETRERPVFQAAERAAGSAHRIGALSSFSAFAAAVLPLVAWTLGIIDSFDTALRTSLIATALTGAAFWIWEATRPPPTDAPAFGLTGN